MTEGRVHAFAHPHRPPHDLHVRCSRSSRATPGERRAYADVVADLLAMREAAAALRARRLAEGSLDFDLVEAELVYEEGRLLAVAAAERNEAHRLIEEFMVAANVAVAAAFTDAEAPRDLPRPPRARRRRPREAPRPHPGLSG